MDSLILEAQFWKTNDNNGQQVDQWSLMEEDDWTYLRDVDQAFPPFAQSLKLYKAAKLHETRHSTRVDLMDTQQYITAHFLG